MIYFLIGLTVTQLASILYIYKIKKQIKDAPPSKELREFIHDLSKGSALIAMRVDSENLLLRSPRQ